MNILYVVPSLKKSGPINVCLSLIKNLSLKHSVSVLAFQNGDAYDEFFKYSKSINIIPAYSIFNILKLMTSGGFTIIHSHCLIPDVILAFYGFFINKNKTITVSTIHNYIDVDYVLSKGKFIGKAMGVVNRISFRLIRNIVSCSESVRDFCEKEYGLYSYAIVNGVEDILKNSPPQRPDKKNIDFFYLGVLNKRKNVTLIIDSFNIYTEKYCVDDCLHIIGGGELLDELKNKNTNKNIIFHGVQSKPLNFIKTLDVYVSSSKAEGMPLALLESLSCGKPFICSEIPPHCEVYNTVKLGRICRLTEHDYVSSFKEAKNWDLNIFQDVIIESFRYNYSDSVMSEKYEIKYMELANKNE